MNVPARDVPQHRFFVTADQPPNNVYVMLMPPRQTGKSSVPIDPADMRKLKQHFSGVEDMLLCDDVGLCQNINDESYWHIEGRMLVRLLREDEHDQTTFTI